MFVLKRLFLLIIVLMSCSFKSRNGDIVKRGNVIYSFASGKMQCQSESDSEGHIFVLLKSLDKNTSLRFVDVFTVSDSKAPGFVVKSIMEVSEDTNLCASWKNIQEVSIKIEPLLVNKISLDGKKVHESDQITVMVL